MVEQAVPGIPKQLVVFRVGPTAFGVDIAAVQEILPLLPVTRTPGAPAGVLGLADVRSKVIPVFDLHLHFGLTRPNDSRETRLIVVDAGAAPVAVLVDGVDQVVNVDPADIQPARGQGSVSAPAYVNGVLRTADRLVLWVEPEALIPEPVQMAAAA